MTERLLAAILGVLLMLSLSVGTTAAGEIPGQDDPGYLAALDLWLKEIAPTPELREWFGHDPAHFNEFRVRYRVELERNIAAVYQLLRVAARHDTTLFYAARDSRVNHAIVLAEYLAEQGVRFEPDR